MGWGPELLKALYATAEKLDIAIVYETPVNQLLMQDQRVMNKSITQEIIIRPKPQGCSPRMRRFSRTQKCGLDIWGLVGTLQRHAAQNTTWSGNMAIAGSYALRQLVRMSLSSLGCQRTSIRRLIHWRSISHTPTAL